MAAIRKTNEATLSILIGMFPLCFSLVIMISTWWSINGSALADSVVLDLLLRILVVAQVFFAVIWLMSLILVIRSELLNSTLEYRRKRLTIKEIKGKYYDYEGVDDI